MVIGDKTFCSRRQFLTGAAAVAGSAILMACGGTSGVPTSGANQGCKAIRTMIATDNSRIQALQRQKANTSDPAKKAQIDTQIAGIRQGLYFFVEAVGCCLLLKQKTTAKVVRLAGT